MCARERARTPPPNPTRLFSSAGFIRFIFILSVLYGPSSSSRRGAARRAAPSLLVRAKMVHGRSPSPPPPLLPSLAPSTFLLPLRGFPPSIAPTAATRGRILQPLYESKSRISCIVRYVQMRNVAFPFIRLTPMTYLPIPYPPFFNLFFFFSLFLTDLVINVA